MDLHVHGKILYVIVNGSFFVIAPNWTQPECATVDELFMYMNTTEYYWVIKINKLLINTTWMDLAHHAKWKKKKPV